MGVKKKRNVRIADARLLLGKLSGDYLARNASPSSNKLGGFPNLISTVTTPHYLGSPKWASRILSLAQFSNGLFQKAST